MLTKGFTLIEVLIALAILAIAGTGLLMAQSRITQNFSRLESRVQASWVSENLMNEVRLKKRKVGLNQTAKGDSRQMGRLWRWQISKSPTDNPNIEKLEVTVFDEDHLKVLKSMTYTLGDSKQQNK